MLTLEYLKDKLEIIQKLTGAYVCIAGGAPRDILNNKPVNDIDCFISVNESFESLVILDILKEDLNIKIKLLKRNQKYQQIGTVAEGIYEEYKWQFIFLLQDKPNNLHDFTEDVLNNFDYCLCQVAIYPYTISNYVSTNEYEADVINKTLTAHKNQPYEFFQTDKAKARLAKLLAKYPDFTHIPLPEPQPRAERDAELLQRGYRWAIPEGNIAAAPQPNDVDE